MVVRLIVCALAGVLLVGCSAVGDKSGRSEDNRGTTVDHSPAPKSSSASEGPAARSSAFRLVFPPSNGICRGTCFGGTTPGESCFTNVNCGQGGTCANKTCKDGPLKGSACTFNESCAGCKKDPPLGNCLVTQIAITRVSKGLAGQLDLVIEEPDGDGVAALRIPAESVSLEPLAIDWLGIACLSAAADATGFIACDGNETARDTLVEIDHNTTPRVCLTGPNSGMTCTTEKDCAGGICNLSNGGASLGLPDDPACAAVGSLPNGSEEAACQEGNRFCVGGDNANRYCGNDADCPGGTCTPTVCGDTRAACSVSLQCPGSRCAAFVCRGGNRALAPCAVDADCPAGRCMPCSPDGTHFGVCQSPPKVTASRTMAPGDLTIELPLGVQLLAFDGSQNGPDQLPCTPDDGVDGPPTPVKALMTTGMADSRIYDFNNAKGAQLSTGSRRPCSAGARSCAEGELCRGSVDGQPCRASAASCECRVPCSGGACLTTLTGAPSSCAMLEQGKLTGRLVGSFPALDTHAGDLVALFQVDLSAAVPLP